MRKSISRNKFNTLCLIVVFLFGQIFTFGILLLAYLSISFLEFDLQGINWFLIRFTTLFGLFFGFIPMFVNGFNQAVINDTERLFNVEIE